MWEKQAYCLKIPYPVNGSVEDTTFMNISYDHLSVLISLQILKVKFALEPFLVNMAMISNTFIVQLMHTTLKNVELLKTFLKQRRLLQRVSVYNETIIREPQPVLS